MNTREILRVDGMTCGGCERSLERAVGKLPGVSRVRASHRQGTLEVDFDPDALARDLLLQTIRDVGFSPA